MKIINTSQAMPKPGRYVLAWMEGAKIPMRAMWAAQHTLPLGDDADPEWGEYSEEKDEYFCPAGWYEMNQHEEQHWGVDGNVVAWCELPRLDAGAAPAAAAPRGEYPHEQMDAMALARYKVVPSHASMLWSHAVVAGDGTQQLYVGREVECQNMARKFAGAFLDGAFAFHSTAAAPTAQAAPDLEAPAAPAPAVPDGATPGPWFVRRREVNGELRDCFVAAPDCQGLAYDACILCDDEYHDGVGRKLADCELIVAAVNQHRAALAAAPQAPAKGLPYEPTSAMLVSARECDPALPIETIRAIWWAMWRTAPQAPAAPAVDAFTHAELLEIKRAVEEFADCNETDVDYALLLRAAQAGYLECTQFHVLNQSALDLDTVAAAQAKEGGEA